MTEPNAPPGLRCPWCHDDLPAGLAGAEAAVVACARCAAPHHVACWVEAGRCSATACGEVRARLGRVEVGAEALAALADDPAALRRLGRPSLAALAASGALGLGVLGALGAFQALVSAGHLDPCLAVSAGLVTVLAALALASLLRQGAPARLERPVEPLTGMGLMPEPTDDVARRLFRRAGPAPPPLPANRRPASCSACGASLAPDLEEIEDDGAWFCHHCGAPLDEEGPEGPGAGDGEAAGAAGPPKSRVDARRGADGVEPGVTPAPVEDLGARVDDAPDRTPRTPRERSP